MHGVLNDFVYEYIALYIYPKIPHTPACSFKKKSAYVAFLATVVTVIERYALFFILLIAQKILMRIISRVH